MLNYDFGLERKGLLLCIRALEDESGLNEMSYEKVFSISAEIDPSYTTVSHQSPFNISEIERGKFLIETLQRYARSKAVVTDRLHGMIFSIITKTPCVVLSAETTKLSEYAANFADTPAVRFIDRDIERLAPAIHDMLSVENAVYSFPNAGVFAEMAQIIKGKV
jgi:exopolysaccharide biosynthesis predicted pyruvyltransferase EpsI